MRTSDRQFRKDLDRTVGGLEDAAARLEPVVPRESRPVAYPAKHRKTWQHTTLAERLRSLTRKGDRRGA